MRIVLFGTGEFALPVFEALIETPEHTVVGVYTQPDRTGRGHHRHVNKVKELATEHDVPVFQPQRVNDPEQLRQLAALQGDIFVVAAYGQILKPEFLAIPPFGAFNLHGSILPRHRGAAPVQYSVWNGDELAGVTFFRIEPALDSGPVIGSVSTPIEPRETSGELMMRLADLSISLTLESLARLAAGTAVPERQNESLVTLAPKIRKDDGIIDWTRSATEIDCHIRAMQPWPRAATWLHVNDRTPIRCLVTEAEPAGTNSNGSPGAIVQSGQQTLVITGHGDLEVKKIQPEGKKAMNPQSLLNGYGIKEGALFGPQDRSLR